MTPQKKLQEIMLYCNNPLSQFTLRLILTHLLPMHPFPTLWVNEWVNQFNSQTINNSEAEAYLRPCQTSMVKFFAKIFNDQKHSEILLAVKLEFSNYSKTSQEKLTCEPNFCSNLVTCY